MEKKIMMTMILASIFAIGAAHELCRGKITIETNPKRLIYGCTYQAEGRVDTVDTCQRECIYSRLIIIGKYNSGWTPGTEKVSHKYMAFVAGTVDVVFEWICIECGTHGREVKRFPIGG